jgi:hypothetical protein
LSCDTTDIKKLIRKINIKTQTFECDHRKCDKAYYKFESDVAQIYLSDSYNSIRNFKMNLEKALDGIINVQKASG